MNTYGYLLSISHEELKDNPSYAQVDSPFDYTKSSIGCMANHIDILTLGLTKWHYQDNPNDESPMPYIAACEQDSITVQLKGIDINTMESLACNYFIPNQNLKILFVILNKILTLVFMVQQIYRTNRYLTIFTALYVLLHQAVVRD